MEIFDKLVEEKFKLDLKLLEEQILELEKLIKEKKKQKEILTSPKEALKDKINRTKEVIKEIITNNNIQEIASDFKGIRIYVDSEKVEVKLDLTQQQKETINPKKKSRANTSIVPINKTNNM